MNCPRCHADLETGQQFCIQCGTNVGALTLPAPPAGPLPVPPAGPLPTTPATVPIAVAPPAAAPAPAPDAFAPPTQPLPPPPGAAKAFAIVEQTGHQAAPVPDPVPDHVPDHVPDGVPVGVPVRVLDEPTGQFGAAPGPVTEAVPYPAGFVPSAGATPAGRGSTVLAVLSGIAGVAAAIAAFVPILRVRTDAPIVDVGVYKSNDLYLGTNLLIALLVVAACLIGGGVLAVLGRRIGAGLAAGAGLSLVPVVIIMYGGVDMISQRAEANAFEVAAAGGGGTFFQTRLEVGLWILVGAAALGVIVFMVSLLQAGGDGRPRLNVAVGVAGALAAVAAVAGQMIPGDYTTFSSNFDDTIGGHAIVYGRLGLIAVVAVCGAVGFLRNNRWGLGLALGSAAIWTWQWLSSVTELGDTPLPPGFVPFGSSGDLKPHIVTTVGVVAVLVLAVIALLTPQPKRP